MHEFSLDHLSETEFEQFCYDLLQDLGFSDLNWRKGTGLATSPSDNGRDIECQLKQKRIDGEIETEKWFVECKHYKNGVPADKIMNALSWASAERPDKLLIIASNFLSNSTKNYIKSYIESNKPPYKIIYWERPILENLTSTHSILLKKYRLSGDYPFLALLHPSHIACIQDMPLNTLGYFFNCLDDLDPQKRDRIFNWAFDAIIQPRFRKSITGKEIMAELQIDRVDYPHFKQCCYQIAQSGLLDQRMLTYLIVSFTLNTLFHVGDTTTTDVVQARLIHAKQYFQEQLDKRPNDQEGLLKAIAHAEQSEKETPDRLKRNYEDYIYFCEHVLEKLRLEPAFSNDD